VVVAATVLVVVLEHQILVTAVKVLTIKMPVAAAAQVL